MPQLPDAPLYAFALFAALATFSLALALLGRAVNDAWCDRQPLISVCTAYRLTVAAAALFMMFRTGPTALVLLFDHPYPLTAALTTHYWAVMLSFPLAVLFAMLVEFSKGPIMRRLKERPIELARPSWPQVRKELSIVAACLVLASLVVMGRG